MLKQTNMKNMLLHLVIFGAYGLSLGLKMFTACPDLPFCSVHGLMEPCLQA